MTARKTRRRWISYARYHYYQEAFVLKTEGGMKERRADWLTPQIIRISLSLFVLLSFHHNITAEVCIHFERLKGFHHLVEFQDARQRKQDTHHHITQLNNNAYYRSYSNLFIKCVCSDLRYPPVLNQKMYLSHDSVI